MTTRKKISYLIGEIVQTLLIDVPYGTTKIVFNLVPAMLWGIFVKLFGGADEFPSLIIYTMLLIGGIVKSYRDIDKK